MADQESNERNENQRGRICDLVADVMKNPIRARKSRPQIYKDTNSQAAIVFHVDDPILASSHQQTAQVWNQIGEHMLLKAHEVMTPDRPIKHLSRRYLQMHTHGTGGFKVVFLWNTLTALRVPWKWSVVDRELFQGASTAPHSHMLKHLWTWCWYTQGRFECTHGGVLNLHTEGKEEGVIASSAYQQWPT